MKLHTKFKLYYIYYLHVSYIPIKLNIKTINTFIISYLFILFTKFINIFESKKNSN